MALQQLHLRPMAAIFLAGMTVHNVQAADSASEQDYLQDFPIVLSASRLSQPISETPNAMTVIDRKMIDASGARTIAELFRLVPGMYVGYADGHTPIISYRGTTDGYARRMQVLIDGRTVYLPPYGQVNWAELPLDIGDIERIEVVRGPSAASHGSNSVQGVISIISRPAAAVSNAQATIRRGDGGIMDVSARTGGVSEDWDYRLTVASRADDGFDDHDNAIINDTNSIKLVNLRSVYRATGSDSIDMQLGYGDSTSMAGKTLVFDGDIDTLRDVKTLSNFQQITWLHTVHENSDVQLSYYHIGQIMQDNRYAAPDPLSGGPQVWVADEIFLHRHELELQHTLITSSANRVVWGTGVRRDSVDSPINLLAPLTWEEYRFFAHDEWRITPNSILNTGAMAEKNAMGVTRVSPRVAYNYHLSARHTLRASLSVAYRNPEMMEEVGDRRIELVPGTYQQFKATGGASPEKAISREIGYISQIDDAGSTLDIRAYHDQISNIIWVDPALVIGAINSPPPLCMPCSPFYTTPPASFRNDFSATYTGLEATLNYRLGESSTLTANYAHQLVRATPLGSLTLTPFYPSLQSIFYEYADKYSKTVPLNSASLLLDQNLAYGMRLGAGYYYQDRVHVLDRTDGQPIMRRLDLKIAKRFGSSINQGSELGGGEIALVVQNALDDNSYTDYNPAAQAKRRAYLAATLEF